MTERTTSTQSLNGKTVIFINSGGKKKRFTLEAAKRLGCKIVLVHSEDDTPKKLYDHFIKVDSYNYIEVISRLEQLQEEHSDLSYDGAITFWEDDIPVLARICEHFSLNGNTFITAINTRNKFEMRQRLEDTGLGIPKFWHLGSKDDLEDAIEQVGFPAVMKPKWGADSQFVVQVKDEDEARDTYEYLVKNCNEQYDPIYKYNDGFLYEEYVDGMEISLECYAQYGIPHVVGINEKQPIKPPYFIEYGDICPARLDEEVELAAVKLAESSMIALGVQSSLAHIEIKISPNGAKIIEVASRMGGDDIYLNTKTVYGFDLIKTALQIAVGQHVELKKREAKGCVICRYFIPNYSGIVTNVSGVKEAREFKNVLDLVVSKDVGDPVLTPPEGFDNMGWVITKGRTYQEAETVMERAFRRTEINVTRFQRRSVIPLKPNFSHVTQVRNQLIRASKLERVKQKSHLNKLSFGILTNSNAANDPNILVESPGEIAFRLLSERGYKVQLFDMSESPLPIRKIQRAGLDFVLNFCESIYNATQLEPHGAALLDLLQLPYTGSNPSVISLCMDKITVKKLFMYHEIPTPEFDYAYSVTDTIRSDLQFPLIVKPANTDNSYGISNESIVTNRAELKRQLEKIIVGLGHPAIIEEYIEGDEFDVCLFGNDDSLSELSTIRSIFDKLPRGYWHIYGSDAKLKSGRSGNPYDAIRIEKTARVSKKLGTLISSIAQDVYSLFDLSDYGKIEFRVDKEGNPYVLEVNPNPPIGKEDFMTIAAKVAGYDHGGFIEELIFSAIQRYRARAGKKMGQ